MTLRMSPTPRNVAIFLFAALFLATPRDSMGIPDAANCSVTPADNLGGLFLCPTEPAPHPASLITVTVRNAANSPIDATPVTVLLTTQNVVCGSTVLNGTTKLERAGHPDLGRRRLCG